MFRTVALPLWLLILILLFAAVTFASHFLFPSVRWFFRRRMERVVTKLNERLDRPIQPFKLARRHDTIQRLIYDPQVAQAIVRHARNEGVPENVAFETAKRYAREIVPAFSASAYFGVAIRLARFVSERIYKVRLSHNDEDALRNIDPNATVVFVMNHRSNMDYVLVTYLAAQRSALSYAVGEWAHVWPLRGLIRAMGAYFIRRKSPDLLYRRVLARYVELATQNGVAQAVFPEGRLSLDGRVGAPKLGILSYILTGANPELGNDVVFVPVAINYDRVLEDRVLLEAAATGQRRFGLKVWPMLGFVARQIKFKLTGRYHRFGFAAVSFAAPLSLTAFNAEGPQRSEEVGEELMNRLRRAMPVLPVPLVASILVQADGKISWQALRTEVAAQVQRLKGEGVDVHLPNDDAMEAADTGLTILRLRRMVKVEAGICTVVEKERAAIEYYAASIEPHMNAVAAIK